MTLQLVGDEKVTLDKTLSSALIASGGDVALVVERYNIARPTEPISAPDVLDAFINTASTNTSVQSDIKSMLMLTLLQILTECKTHLSQSLPDFSPTELFRTIEKAVEGITQLMPQAPAPATTQVNLLQQFDTSHARERVAAKLEGYQQIEAQYSQIEQTN